MVIRTTRIRTGESWLLGHCLISSHFHLSGQIHFKMHLRKLYVYVLEWPLHIPKSEVHRLCCHQPQGTIGHFWCMDDDNNATTVKAETYADMVKRFVTPLRRKKGFHFTSNGWFRTEQVRILPTQIWSCLPASSRNESWVVAQWGLDTPLSRPKSSELLSMDLPQGCCLQRKNPLLYLGRKWQSRQKLPESQRKPVRWSLATSNEERRNVWT